MTKRVLIAAVAAVVLGGCPKSGTRIARDLAATKWEGWINVNSSCEEHGGYTGNDLRVCMIFGEPDGGLVGVDVDWDSQNLRPACDYFVFAGAVTSEQSTLVRFDPEEGDDRFRLVRAGDRMTGTFQVHPSCAPWPVELAQIPRAPGTTAHDPLQPVAPEPMMPPPDEELPL
ncbi:MAG: hypothetical protein ACI8S6_004048 [Myxococcota bacterium]|jgi:hypothetical protein